jgi:hypothetical protein
MRKPLNELLQREMTRKQFLTTLGVGAVAVMGLSSLFKLLGGKNYHALKSGAGYGGSVYGR